MGKAPPLSLTITVAAVSPDRLRLMPEVAGGLEGKKVLDQCCYVEEVPSSGYVFSRCREISNYHVLNK